LGCCSGLSFEADTSQIFEVYEDMFSLHQGDKSLAEYYSQFKGLID